MADQRMTDGRIKAQAVAIALERYAEATAWILYHGDGAGGVSHAERRRVATGALAPFPGLLDLIEGSSDTGRSATDRGPER